MTRGTPLPSPPLPSPPLPSPPLPSPPLPSPPLPSPPLPSPPLPSPPFLPLVTQRIHSPFQPKQSPSARGHLCVICVSMCVRGCSYHYDRLARFDRSHMVHSVLRGKDYMTSLDPRRFDHSLQLATFDATSANEQQFHTTEAQA